jgi:hypothetical protein
MAKCIKCGDDTLLLVNGVPLCPRCDKLQTKTKPTNYPMKPKDYNLSE